MAGWNNGQFSSGPASYGSMVNYGMGNMSSFLGNSPESYLKTSDLVAPNFNIPNMGGIPNVNTASSPSMWDSMIGSKDAPGWGGLALGAAQGLGNMWMGYKGLQNAQNTLKENRRQFDLNWGAQAKTTNAQLAGQHSARLAAGGVNYSSLNDYMKKYGI